MLIIQLTHFCKEMGCTHPNTSKYHRKSGEVVMSPYIKRAPTEEVQK